jgi:hypothetical protein
MFWNYHFENEIWLAIKVNKAENIKTLGFFYWVGTKLRLNTKEGNLWHKGFIPSSFDENDKIDVVNQYLDRATIMEAMKNKKWFLK